MPKNTSPLDGAHRIHSRQFSRNKFVYPVISRRSGGVSLGINLNPDKVCNFDCPYCQVDRTVMPGKTGVSLKSIELELKEILKYFTAQGECMLPLFENLPRDQKILKDVALAGDGEPTTFAGFKDVCEMLRTLQKSSALPFSLNLITNASLLSKSEVRQGIGYLLEQKGSVWAKLDAGNEAYYQKVNQSKIPFSRIVENLKGIGDSFPVTLQSLFFKMEDEGPDQKEIHDYIRVLGEILAAGVVIDEIQIHSLSRKPSNPKCQGLSKIELEAIGEQVRLAYPLSVNVY